MRKIQDSNISLRISENLKKTLTEFSLRNELHSSSVIRQALIWYLQRHMQEERSGVTSSNPSPIGGEVRSGAWLST